MESETHAHYPKIRDYTPVGVMVQVMSTRLPAPLPAENSWGIIFRAIQVISGNNYLYHYLPNIFGNLICNSFGALVFFTCKVKG